MINPSANASHPSPKRCVHALVATGKGFSWLAWFPKVVIYSFFLLFLTQFYYTIFYNNKKLGTFPFPVPKLGAKPSELVVCCRASPSFGQENTVNSLIAQFEAQFGISMFPVSSPAPMTAESNSGSVNGTHFWGDETWCISRVILREFPQASALLGLVIFWPPDKELEDFFWKSPKKAYKVLLWLCQAVGFV